MSRASKIAPRVQIPLSPPKSDTLGRMVGGVFLMGVVGGRGCQTLAERGVSPAAPGDVGGLRRHVATQVATLRPSSRFKSL